MRNPNTGPGSKIGTTENEGANGTNGVNGYGTVFKIAPDGTLTTLYSFCSQSGCANGGHPVGGLIQAGSGNLYGTASEGGLNGGTVFRITTSGALKTLYAFCSQPRCIDGSSPLGGLIQATNGSFYGTTNTGGINFYYGTVFEMTPGGTLTTLYSFCSQSGCADGAQPLMGLVQATDGYLYGTTSSSSSFGTIFKISLGGTMTTLYNFGGTGAETPDAALVQATSGNFYGSSKYGGKFGAGTIFVLSTGLGPFVETRPTWGKVGGHVEILGGNLTDASSVIFNGVPALFRAVSNSLITATVPSGATGGTVQVVTPILTLPSNAPFHVLP
jgi:uncharacterized repeat protein (TIGR03803 family)